MKNRMREKGWCSMGRFCSDLSNLSGEQVASWYDNMFCLMILASSLAQVNIEEEHERGQARSINLGNGLFGSSGLVKSGNQV